jgi:hypothetical protein
MSLKNLMLLLAVGGVGVALYRTAKEAGLRIASGHADAEELAPFPNLGEPSNVTPLANAGIGPSDVFGQRDLLARPSGDEQQSDQIRPGLPDFARGA